MHNSNIFNVVFVEHKEKTIIKTCLQKNKLIKINSVPSINLYKILTSINKKESINVNLADQIYVLTVLCYFIMDKQKFIYQKNKKERP